MTRTARKLCRAAPLLSWCRKRCRSSGGHTQTSWGAYGLGVHTPATPPPVRVAADALGVSARRARPLLRLASSTPPPVPSRQWHRDGVLNSSALWLCTPLLLHDQADLLPPRPSMSPTGR